MSLPLAVAEFVRIQAPLRSRSGILTNPATPTLEDKGFVP